MSLWTSNRAPEKTKTSNKAEKGFLGGSDICPNDGSSRRFVLTRGGPSPDNDTNWEKSMHVAGGMTSTCALPEYNELWPRLWSVAQTRSSPRKFTSSSSSTSAYSSSALRASFCLSLRILVNSLSPWQNTMAESIYDRKHLTCGLQIQRWAHAHHDGEHGSEQTSIALEQ